MAPVYDMPLIGQPAELAHRSNAPALLQESEDEQLARAIAASLGQAMSSSAADQPPSQVAAAHPSNHACHTVRHYTSSAGQQI